MARTNKPIKHARTYFRFCKKCGESHHPEPGKRKNLCPKCFAIFRAELGKKSSKTQSA